MADILIRGMEMPKEGEKILIAADGSVWANAWPTRGYMRMENVCAVPLPAGHGRLGDLETAEAILHNKTFDLAGTSAEYNALNWALRQIKALPTIVPAEGGGEDGN